MPKKYKSFVECPCGVKIYGRTEFHAKANLKIHKHGKIHKTRMDARR